MPSSKRKPIEYTPQYSEAIFRPKAVVESELAAVAGEEPAAESDREERTSERPNVRTSVRSTERPNERPNETIGEGSEDAALQRIAENVRSAERTNDATGGSIRAHQSERPNVRTSERPKVRHSFDIYADQLFALAEIQAEQFRKTGRKPKVGDLVQAAIDAYIRGKRRTSERPND